MGNHEQLADKILETAMRQVVQPKGDSGPAPLNFNRDQFALSPSLIFELFRMRIILMLNRGMTEKQAVTTMAEEIKELPNPEELWSYYVTWKNKPRADTPLAKFLFQWEKKQGMTWKYDELERLLSQSKQDREWKDFGRGGGSSSSGGSEQLKGSLGYDWYNISPEKPSAALLRKLIEQVPGDEPERAVQSGES